MKKLTLIIISIIVLVILLLLGLVLAVFLFLGKTNFDKTKDYYKHVEQVEEENSKYPEQPGISEVSKAMRSTTSFYINEEINSSVVNGYINVEYIAPNRMRIIQTGDVQSIIVIIEEDAYELLEDGTWSKMDPNGPYPDTDMESSMVYPIYVIPQWIYKSGEEDGYWYYRCEHQSSEYEIFVNKSDLLVYKMIENDKSINGKSVYIFSRYNDPEIVIDVPQVN